eukprot:TRINITY_DN32824_c0_g1_i1.p1 TRINITY_DN32824_c0_g1~~TRINITY_DN32824_c0_g1_i1.p1  ORF type:complete len:1256 (+),score=187.27 TRINITY_DN32824_c0_g1_i1:212-3979(+)
MRRGMARIYGRPWRLPACRRIGGGARDCSRHVASLARSQCHLASVRHRLSLGCVREAHVARVTVIPLDSSETTADVNVAQSVAERATTDLAMRETVQKALGGLRNAKDVSRATILDAVRTLRWLHKESSDPGVAIDIDDYWDVIYGLSLDQIRCLHSADVVELFTALADCDRRPPELIRLLHQHCRRTIRCFCSDDIASSLRAFSRMSWRSKKTIRQMNRRLHTLLLNSETAPAVTVAHMREMMNIYPQLNVPVTGTNPGKSSTNESVELELFKAIAVALPSRFEEMTSRDYSIILNAFAQLRLAFTSVHRNMVRLFEICVPRLVSKVSEEQTMTNDEASFKPRDISMIVNAYARIGAGPYAHPLFQTVALRMAPSEQMDRCSFLELSLILNAFAKLGISNSEVFEAAAPVVINTIRTYDPQALSNVAHAFARQMLRHEAMFERIGTMSTRLIDKFKPLELANLAYGFGRLKVQHKGLWPVLQDEVIYRGTIGKTLQEKISLYHFPLRTVELLSQAFSNFGIKDKRLYFVLFDIARQRMREFAKSLPIEDPKEENTRKRKKKSPELIKAAKIVSFGDQPAMLSGKGLSNLLNSFAKARSDFQTLVRWVPEQVRLLHGQFTAWELASIVNASSLLGVVHRPLYRELMGYARPRVSQMDPHSVALMVRAMARARSFDRQVMRMVAKVVSVRLNELDIMGMNDLMVGCAEMGYRDEKFFRLIAVAMRGRTSEMTSEHLALFVGAYGKMRIDHPNLLDSLLFELFKRQHELSERNATMVAHAFLLVAASQRHAAEPEAGTSRGNHGWPLPAPAANANGEEISTYPFNKHQGVFYAMLDVVNDRRKNLSYPSIFRLQMVELYVRLFEPRVFNEMRLELKALLVKARRINVVVDDYMQNSSMMHRSISRWFHRVGLHHRSEVFLGPFMLDMLIGTTVVVEVDGPFHFYRDTNSRSARSILKDFLLRRMGFHVVHLPYQEWNQCGSAQKKMMYCASFWRNVLAVQLTPSSGEGGKSLRLPPMVDVLDMVVRAQRDANASRDRDNGNAVDSRDVGKQLSGSEPNRGLPAFYADGGEPDLRESDEAAEGSCRSAYNLNAEQAGVRSVEQMLSAHQEAEESLSRDRARGISSRQRQSLDGRNRRRPPAQGSPTTSADLDGNFRQDSRGGEPTYTSGIISNTATATTAAACVGNVDSVLSIAGAVDTSPSSKLDDAAVMAQLRSVMPRSRRQSPVHSGSSLSIEAEEAFTDSSSDEEEDSVVDSRR